MILTDTIIVKSTLPIRPTTTVVTRSTMTSTVSDPNRSSIITAVSHKTVMSSAKIFSTVPVHVTTSTVISRTQSASVSLASKSVPSLSVIIIQMTSSGQTKEASQGESPTVGPSNSKHMSNEPQTSTQDPSSIRDTHPPIITSTPLVSTSVAVTTGTSSPIEGIGLSGYIIATVVSSVGFLVVCLILIGIALYAVCLRKQRSTNPVATERSLSFSRRPQSQTSMYSNNAYLMNKLKKKEFIPTTSNNSSPSHHHYDTPNFTQSKESDETENRYSTLNRLSQFNRNPAYSITSSCTLTNDEVNNHDYEEV